MNKMFKLIIILFIFQQFHNSNAGTYSIIAPRIVRPGDKYTAIISLQDVNKDTDVICTIKQYKIGNNIPDKFETNTHLTDTQNINLCSIDISYSITEGLYEVSFEGKGGIAFNATFPLLYIYNQFIILIQTDKAIYRPGQDVQFRVIILNQSLKPINEVEIKQIKIYIMDPLEIKLATFTSSEIKELGLKNTNSFKINEGVTENLQFNLHQNVLLGSWNIRVVVKEQVQDYQFFVDNYYLPLANVTIDLPESVTFSDDNLNVRINSFYTFGKPVNGILNLEVSMFKACGNNEKSFKDISVKNITISGQIEQTINISSYLIEKCNQIMLKLKATVEDQFTNSTYEEVEVLKISNSSLIVEHEVPRKRFKPGYLVQIKSLIKQERNNYNRDLIYNVSCKAKIKNKQNNYENTRMYDKYVNENEIFCRYFTNYDTVALRHELIYNDNTLDTVEIPALTGCEKETVQIFLKQPKFEIKPGDVMDFVVNSTVPFKRIIYYVVVRGSISDTIVHNFNSTDITQTFNQKILPSMIPEVTFVVYLSTSGGYLTSDQITLNIKGILNKNIRINVTTPMLNAGETAKFSLESSEDSTVYMLGVDESLISIKQGNDIFESRVLKLLIDLPQTAEENGLYYKTSGLYECSSEYYNMIVDSDDTTVNIKPDKVIRQDLRETWIWDSLLMGKKQKILLKDDVPDVITTWKITAFAIHKFDGLSLIEEPAYVTVYRHFFLKMNLPFKMRREETAEIHLLLFSYLNETSTVELDVYSINSQNINFTNCRNSFSLEPNEIKQISCNVTVTKRGYFNITAVANASTITTKTIYRDGEEKVLYVTFEGRETEVEKPILFQVDETEPVYDNISYSLPYGFVEESLRTFITATPQLIPNSTQVALLDNVKNSRVSPIFNQPHGCCEQRAAEFFPMVYLVDYLNNTNQIKPEDEISAIESIKKHLTMLCFHNPNDGSFTSFDYHNTEVDFNKYPAVTSANELSSVWQTANVLKLLYYAKKYVEVDTKIIENALLWLNKIQNFDGSFVETETRTLFKSHNKDAYLTSFVYITLDLHDMPNQKAAVYLEKNFDRYFSTLDALDVIITCYALHLSKSTLKEACFEKVLKLSLFDKNMTVWQGENSQLSAAYALLLLSHRKSNVIGLNVFKYLTSVRSSYGTFIDTHSTTICTEAMTKFVDQLKHYDSNTEHVKIEFDYKTNISVLEVSPKYGNIQIDEIANTTLNINVRATGSGRAVASVIWSYNFVNKFGDAFEVESSLNKTDNGIVYLNLCTKYNLNGTAQNVITEIDMPTGYKYTGPTTQVGAHTGSFKLAKFETFNDGTQVTLYIDEITNDKLCLKVGTLQTHKVTNARPGSVTVSSYYDIHNPTTNALKVHEV